MSQGDTDSEGATLVLASYNHELYLPDAIASFVAQDHPYLRLIVTDDASTDRSVAVAERELAAHGLDAKTVFHTRNAGICATFNEALALVETPFVAFLAADDWMEPDRFSTQVGLLAGQPEAALAFSDMWIVRDADDITHDRYGSLWRDAWEADHRERLLHDLLENNWIPAPTVMSRTEHLRQVGGYDESLPFEDYDMWLRLAAEGHSFLHVDRPLVFWRRTGGSLTETLAVRSAIDRDLTTLEILGKHLGRSATIDAALAPRLMHLAMSNFKRGDRSPVNSRILRRGLRIAPSLPAAAYAVAATVTQTRGPAGRLSP